MIFPLISWIILVLKGIGPHQHHPDFLFFLIEIYIPIETYAYGMTACLCLPATSTDQHKYIDVSFSSHFSKSLPQKVAATVELGIYILQKLSYEENKLQVWIL